jgi:hypothetical protein
MDTIHCEFFTLTRSAVSDFKPRARVTTKEIGDAFESDVHIALEGLGFTVERNLPIAGNQIDMIATRSGDIASEIYVVETKNHSAPIGVEAIRSYSSLLHSARRTNPRYQGLYISGSGYTAQARSHADKIGITLLDYRDLLLRTFDIQALLRSNIADFESHKGLSCPGRFCGTSQSRFA